MKKTTIIIAIAIIVIIGIIGFSSKKPALAPNTVAQPITIGAVLSLTGMASVDGESIKNGIELAKSELATEGIAVEVKYYDDATDTKQTVGNIQLAKAQGVDAIIGPTWSFLGDAAAPVCESQGIVCYEPANTSEYSSKGKTVFFGTTLVRLISGPLSGLFKEKSITKVSEIHNLGGWGDTNALANASAAMVADVKITNTEKVNFGEEASIMNSFLTKSQNAGATVVVTSIDDDKALFMLLSKAKLFGINTIVAQTTSVRRVVQNQKINLSETGVHVYTIQPKNNDQFIAKFQAVYGKIPGPYADTAYDGMKMLVMGIKNKNSDEHLRDYLKRIPYQGLAKLYKFDENNDVSGGEWEIVQEK